MSSLINKERRVFTNGVYHVGRDESHDIFMVIYVYGDQPHPKLERRDKGGDRKRKEEVAKRMSQNTGRVKMERSVEETNMQPWSS